MSAHFAELLARSFNRFAADCAGQQTQLRCELGCSSAPRRARSWAGSKGAESASRPVLRALVRPAPDLRLLAATECRHAHERVEWKARTAPLLGVEVARAGTEHGKSPGEIMFHRLHYAH